MMIPMGQNMNMRYTMPKSYFLVVKKKKATFLSAYALTKSQLHDVQNIANKGQISAIVKIAANTPARADDNIYALVILNDHNYLTISADNSVAVLKVPGQKNNFVFQKGKTTLVNMEEYASKGPVEGVIDINGTNKLGFLMTNAPLSYSPGEPISQTSSLSA